MRVLLLLISSVAFAQYFPPSGGGSGGNPGGSTGDIQFNAGSSTFGGGRCTMDSSQNIVCTGAVSASILKSGGIPPSVTPGTGGGDAFAEGTNPSAGCPAVAVDCIVGNAAAHRAQLSNNNAALSSIATAADPLTFFATTAFTGDATTNFPALTISNNAITAAKMVNGGVFTGDVTTTFPAITVAKVNGIAYSATAAAHSVEVITTANTTATAKVIPDCQDSAGNHLNYTQSSDTFGCGTSSSVYQTRLGAQAGVSLSGSTDTTLVQSNVITSGTMGNGGCYSVHALFKLAPTASNAVTYKLWFGSAATTGTSLSLPNGSTTTVSVSPFAVHATICNNSGSTTAQTIDAVSWYQQGAGGFGNETTAAFNTGTTNAVISFSGAASSGETVTVQEFTVMPLFPAI